MTKKCLSTNRWENSYRVLVDKAILVAQLCKNVTLVDISPKVLDLVKANITLKGLSNRIRLVEGDITELSQFHGASSSFIVCVGAALSYALDKREKAVQELLRVAKIGATVIVQVQSKLGIIGSKIRKGLIKEAFDTHKENQFTDGMGVKSHLCTVNEFINLLQKYGCEILEIATSPVFTHTLDNQFRNMEKQVKQEDLRLQYFFKGKKKKN